MHLIIQSFSLCHLIHIESQIVLLGGMDFAEPLLELNIAPVSLLCEVIQVMLADSQIC